VRAISKEERHSGRTSCRRSDDVGIAIEEEGVPGNATGNEDGVAAVEAFARTALPFSSVASLAADGVSLLRR
jgi:hypothetical protein